MNKELRFSIIFNPITKAEKTIYWFLHGRRYSSVPNHPNCRCSTKPIIPQPKGSHL
jgi:hypothetical protein